jgi:hypothetical protein
LRSNRFQADPKALETARGNSFTLMDKTEQDVLGTYVIVIEQPGFFLGEYYDSSGPVGKPFKHFLYLKTSTLGFSRAPYEV